MKRCQSCLRELSLDSFGVDKRTSDKLWSKCFSCRGIARPGDTSKKCLMCDEVKPIEQFHKDLLSSDLHRRICKKCGSKSAKNWNATNREKFNANQREWKKAHRDSARASARKNHLKRTYDITDVQYWAMFEAQGRVCAICGTPPRNKHLHVDHNHKTGEVRGLLCSQCNTKLLPILEHHPERAANAVAYLADPPSRKVLYETEMDPGGTGTVHDEQVESANDPEPTEG